MKTLVKRGPIQRADQGNGRTTDKKIPMKLDTSSGADRPIKADRPIRIVKVKKFTKGLAVIVGIVVLAALAAAGVYSISPSSPAVVEQGESNQPDNRVPVVLTPAKVMSFEDSVVVSGSVLAKNYALVSARIPGSLDAVYVDEGDRVEANTTKLFQTDSLKLTKAVAVAQQAVTVAECSLEERRARLEQALAEKEQAERDMKRYQSLVRDNAISRQVLEKQETGFRQAKAAIKDVEALIALAGAQLEQARLSLSIAEKDLADSSVVAPISGRVSRRFKEPGEMAAPGTPVIKIEDVSVLEISVFLPAEHYARVVPGETQMRIEVNGIDVGVRPVAYQSPTVDPKYRTFEVKGLVESPPAGVAPGCLAEVAIVMNSQTGIGVPTVAIRRRGGRSVVFVVDGEQARMVEVKTGLEANGWTQLLDDNLAEGTPVLSMGQHLVEDGTPVSLAQESSQ